MLNSEEYKKLDLIGLSELVDTKQVSAEEVTLTAIREIEAINPKINAVVVTQFEQALDELNSRKDSPRFLGMPYLAKDLHAPVKGLPLANGSRLLKDQVFDFDSITFDRLRKSGFAILGRTSSPEFGLSASTEPLLWGPCRNPYNTEYSAGGSSGGAAAAVASGMLPATHATDSAGSIRIPAARCGLVGLKPTRGLNAFGPHRGDPVLGISHEHAVTKTVRDCAAILDVTAGQASGEPYFTAKPAIPYEELIKQAPGKLKIGFTTESFIDTPIDQECKDAVLDTARMLESLGHDVEEAKPHFDAHAITDAMIKTLMGSMAGIFQMVEQKMGREIRLGDVEPLSMEVVKFAKETQLADHLNRAVILNIESRNIARFFDDYDILLTPTQAEPQIKLGVLDTTRPDLDGFLDLLFRVSPFTAPFSVTGQPAMNMPLHMSELGLPIGVQLIAGFGEDAKLLQLAHTLEQNK